MERRAVALDRLIQLIEETTKWTSARRGVELLGLAKSTLLERLDVPAGLFLYERRFIRDHLGKLERRTRVMEAWGLGKDLHELNRCLDESGLGQTILDAALTHEWCRVDAMEHPWSLLLEGVAWNAYGTWPIIDQGKVVGVMALVANADRVDSKLISVFATQLSIVGSLLISRRRAEDVSRRDPLTGILNRRGLEHFLPSICEEARVSGCALFVGILDVNDFKRINDEYGHSYGDEVLKDIAETLQQFVVGRGTTGRIGGDEYVFVIRDDSSSMDEMRMKLLAVFENKEYEVSVGAARWNPSTSWKRIIDEADAHLYERKRLKSSNGE